jgi:hypothetical protein
MCDRSGHRQALGKVVDQIVAAQLSIGNDIQSANFLILDGGFDGRIVNLVQFLAADPPRKVFGLQTLQPAGHGIASDDGGG